MSAVDDEKSEDDTPEEQRSSTPQILVEDKPLPEDEGEPVLDHVGDESDSASDDNDYEPTDLNTRPESRMGMRDPEDPGRFARFFGNSRPNESSTTETEADLSHTQTRSSSVASVFSDSSDEDEVYTDEHGDNPSEDWTPEQSRAAKKLWMGRFISDRSNEASRPLGKLPVPVLRREWSSFIPERKSPLSSSIDPDDVETETLISEEPDDPERGLLAPRPDSLSRDQAAEFLRKARHMLNERKADAIDERPDSDEEIDSDEEAGQDEEQDSMLLQIQIEDLSLELERYKRMAQTWKDRYGQLQPIFERQQEDLFRQRGVVNELKGQQTFSLALRSFRDGEQWPSEKRESIAKIIVGYVNDENASVPPLQAIDIMELLEKNRSAIHIAEWIHGHQNAYKFIPRELFREILFSGEAFNLGLVTAFLNVSENFENRPEPITLKSFVELFEELRNEWTEQCLKLQLELETAQAHVNTLATGLEEAEADSNGRSERSERQENTIEEMKSLVTQDQVLKKEEIKRLNVELEYQREETATYSKMSANKSKQVEKYRKELLEFKEKHDQLTQTLNGLRLKTSTPENKNLEPHGNPEDDQEDPDRNLPLLEDLKSEMSNFEAKLQAHSTKKVIEVIVEEVKRLMGELKNSVGTQERWTSLVEDLEIHLTNPEPELAKQKLAEFDEITEYKFLIITQQLDESLDKFDAERSNVQSVIEEFNSVVKQLHDTKARHTVAQKGLREARLRNIEAAGKHAEQRVADAKNYNLLKVDNQSLTKELAESTQAKVSLVMQVNFLTGEVNRLGRLVEEHDEEYSKERFESLLKQNQAAMTRIAILTANFHDLVDDHKIVTNLWRLEGQAYMRVKNDLESLDSNYKALEKTSQDQQTHAKDLEKQLARYNDESITDKDTITRLKTDVKKNATLTSSLQQELEQSVQKRKTLEREKQRLLALSATTLHGLLPPKIPQTTTKPATTATTTAKTSGNLLPLNHRIRVKPPVQSPLLIEQLAACKARFDSQKAGIQREEIDAKRVDEHLEKMYGIKPGVLEGLGQSLNVWSHVLVQVEKVVE